MTTRPSIVSVAVLAGFALVAPAVADVVTRNALTPATVAATRALWLTDCGASAPTYTVDFETGFVDNQNVSGLTGLFPGGLVITDSTNARAARVRTGSAIGGSMPYGNFGIAHNEGPYLVLTFPLPGVDAFSLSDIDHTGTSFRVHHANGVISTFSIEETGSGGRIGEFIGVWRNDRAPIVRVEMDSSGDGTWGIDDIMWIVSCPADFNGDGFLDFFDYDDYVRCFELGQCPPGRTGDFNGDGFADFFDYDAFVEAFESGC
jgi:hypothetical protein